MTILTIELWWGR